MVKPTPKKRSEPDVSGPKIRSVPKSTRCFCGARVLKGARCQQDHDALALANGTRLVQQFPQLAPRSGEAYLGPPWLPGKLARFLHLNAHPIHARTLNRLIECPRCRQRTVWADFTYDGCPTAGCNR